MIYWTSKKSGVSIRYRAYRPKDTIFQQDYVLLDKETCAEVYVFLHKQNHGSCIGMIAGEGIQHFKSKEEAFESISKQLK